MHRLIPPVESEKICSCLEQAITEPDSLRRDIESAFALMTRFSERKPRLRVFTNGGTRDDLATQFLRTPIGETQSLEYHLDSLLGENYCLAVNDIASWSASAYSTVTSKFVERWIDRFGESVGGLDVYSFVGRYPVTPFGIHKDDEDSYIVNLGPSEKVVHVWSKEGFVQEFGPDATKLTIFQYSLSYSSCLSYTLAAGAGIYIPRGLYHVFESPGYSVMLGIAPYLPSREKLVTLALSRLMGVQTLQGGFVEYGKEAEELEVLKALFCDRVLAVSREDLQRCFDGELRLLRSNGYVRGSPIPPEEPFEEAGTFSINREHPIERLSIGRRLHIFVRGTELTFGYPDVVSELIDRLNDLEWFSIDSLHEVMCLRLKSGLRQIIYCAAVLQWWSTCQRR